MEIQYLPYRYICIWGAWAVHCFRQGLWLKMKSALKYWSNRWTCIVDLYQTVHDCSLWAPQQERCTYISYGHLISTQTISFSPPPANPASHHLCFSWLVDRVGASGNSSDDFPSSTGGHRSCGCNIGWNYLVLERKDQEKRDVPFSFYNQKWGSTKITPTCFCLTNKSDILLKMRTLEQRPEKSDARKLGVK